MESIFNIDCHKTSRGLFCGIIVLLSTIVTNIMYFIYKNNSVTKDKTNENNSSESVSKNLQTSGEISIESTMIIEILELVLITFALVIAVATVIRTRRLAMIENISIKFDEFLVVLSLCGIYIYSVFSSISIIYNSNKATSAYIVLAISIISMIEGTIQAYLILDGLRRRAIDLNDRRVKPGRELFTLLIIINLSLWISDTFAFKRFDVNPYQLKYYSVLAWSIINTVSSPLAIFFRFHASVCLSDCWKIIYL